mgnify:CR=1 FL=1
MNKDKPFSPPADRNKGPILDVLKEAFRNSEQVLEIGSGTGQHAVHFAQNLPHLTWQTSDLEENHTGIRLWLEEAALPNVKEPLILDVTSLPWKSGRYDAVFSANTLHIMSKLMVECLFKGLGDTLAVNGTLCVYGPFNYGGEYTSETNRKFDKWLLNQNPESAIRDFEWVNSLAEQTGLSLINDHEMPANNRLLAWRKQR